MNEPHEKLTALGAVVTTPSAALECFPAPERGGPLRMETREFTCLCPRTRQPDFARVRIWYQPDKLCVELKTLKLYLWSFREQGMFHEYVARRICDDLAAATAPTWMLVEVEYDVRGGIYTTTYAAHGDVPGWLLEPRVATPCASI